MGFRLDRPDLQKLKEQADPNCKRCYGKGFYASKHVCFGPDPHTEFEKCFCIFKRQDEQIKKDLKRLQPKSNVL